MALRERRLSALMCLVAGLSTACSDGEADSPDEAVAAVQPRGGSSGAGGGSGAAGSSSGGSSSGAPAASGGASGSAGATGSTPTETVAFAAGLDGFRINYYCAGNPPACVQVMDAAPEGEGSDAGAAPPPANDFVEAAFDATEGDPEPGAARVTLQFSADGQLAEFARNFGTSESPGLNLTGKVITARARVEAGGAPTVVAKMYVKTGMTYSYADSGETTLLPGTWVTLRYQTPSYVNDAAVYDIADVREIGIEILGRGVTAPTATVVHLDTIEY